MATRWGWNGMFLAITATAVAGCTERPASEPPAPRVAQQPDRTPNPVEQPRPTPEPESGKKPEDIAKPALPGKVQPLLQECDAAWQERARLARAGKFKEAAEKGEKAIEIEIQVHGPKHVGTIAKLQLLAQLHTDARNFVRAEQLRGEVVERQIGRFGANAWQVVDARQDLQDVQTLARLTPEQNAELLQSAELRRQALRGVTPSTAKFPPQRWQESADLSEKALTIRRRVLGKGHHLTDQSLRETTWLTRNAGKPDKTRVFADELLRARRATLGDSHPSTAFAHTVLAGDCRAQKDWSGVVEHAKQALAIHVKILGPNAPASKASFDRTIQYVDLLTIASQSGHAQTLIDCLWDHCATSLKEHPDEVNSILGRLAQAQLTAENFAVAEKLRREVLARQIARFGEKSWPVTDARLDVADVQALKRLSPEQRAELKAAERLVGQGYAAVTPMNDKHPPEKWKASAQLLERAFDMHRRVLGADQRLTGTIAFNASEMWQRAGNLAKARGLIEENLRIGRKNLGEDHPALALSYGRLANICQEQKDQRGLGENVRKALATYVKALGPNAKESQASLTRATHAVNALTGGETQTHCEKMLEICVPTFGEYRPETVSLLKHLGWCVEGGGDRKTAIEHFKRAHKICLKLYGEGNPDTAETLMWVGVYLRMMNDHDAAEKVFLKALASRGTTVPKDHVVFAMALGELAAIRQARASTAKELAEAAALLKDAIEIQRKHLKFGHEFDQLSVATAHLAELQWRLGDKKAARQSTLESIELARKGGHTNFSFFLSRAALRFHFEGETAQAHAYFDEAFVRIQKQVEVIGSTMSERQHLNITQNWQRILGTFFTLPADSPERAEAAYTQLLRWKGVVLSRQIHERLARQTPELAPMAKEIQTLVNDIATLASSPQKDDDEKGTWRDRVAQMTARKEKLERQLASTIAASPAAKLVTAPTARQISSTLPANVALVEYFMYFHSSVNQKGSIDQELRLSAFVVRQGEKITRIDFGPAYLVSNAIAKWGEQTKRPPGKDHPGVQLRKLIWQPLEAHLAGVDTVLVSPDGPLGDLPFAALPGKAEGSYLLEELAIAALPVPRLLPLMKKAEKMSPSLLLVGDVDFDATPGARSFTSRTAEATTRNGARLNWQALPGTSGEIDAIKGTFARRFPNAAVDTLRGDHANEANLRGSAPKRSILHLATHGFFSTETKEGVTDFHPGLLSGLVLAGANRPVVAGRDDGILTAVEVAELDLTHVDLAVLSACETGLGKRAGGEGVLGLQRAFQVAGARTTITSLWSVPDEPTRVLMEHFYANLWDEQKPRTKLAALREAQLWMLREGRSHAGVQRGIQRIENTPEPATTGRLPPYYWAAFVLSGDWR